MTRLQVFVCDICHAERRQTLAEHVPNCVTVHQQHNPMPYDGFVTIITGTSHGPMRDAGVAFEPLREFLMEGEDGGC